MSTDLRQEIKELRRARGWSIRTIARYMGMTVPQVHQKCGCPNAINCTGAGCAIGR